MEPRLKSEFWIQALIRRCQSAGAFAAVVRRGDDSAGSIIVKINTLDGDARALVPGVGPDGNRVWRSQPTGEAALETDVDAYIARAFDRDPDLWVIEIEDRQGRHFFDEPVE